MRRRSRPRSLLALVLVASLGACYTYVPVEQGVPERGDEVRVHLTGDRDGSRAGSAPGAAYLQGMVVASGPDSLTFWRRPVMRSGTRVDEFLRDTTTVALSEVERLERSELDGVKTGAAVVGSLGLVAGLALIVVNADVGGTGDGGGGDGGGTLGISVPFP